MLKVYEWLVYNFMRPHKKFQHLIKWFDICFIRTKTNIQKNRKERLNRNQKSLPLALGVAQLPWTAQPTRTPLSSSTPRCQAARWRGADAVVATSTPRTFQAAPCHLFLSWRTAVQPFFISPSSLVLSLPLLVFPFFPESVRRSSSTRTVASAGEKPEGHVHRARRSLLPLHAADGAVIWTQAAGIELEPPPDPQVADVEFAATTTSPTSLTPLPAPR